MADVYPNYKALRDAEEENVDFRVVTETRNMDVLVAALHGGGIEPGTSEIAERIAAEELSVYLFEGIKPSGNGHLHMTSTQFDEPRGIVLASAHNRVLTVHGCEDGRPKRHDAFVGGRDGQMKDRLRDVLLAAGFRVDADLWTPGEERLNFCNRGASGAGGQLEISSCLRARMFASLKRAGRRQPTTVLNEFCDAVRRAVVEVIGET